MNNDNITIACPRCKKPSLWQPENPHRPFCSQRCRLADLGAWLDGEHKIPDNTPEPPHE